MSKTILQQFYFTLYITPLIYKTFATIKRLPDILRKDRKVSCIKESFLPSDQDPKLSINTVALIKQAHFWALTLRN